MATHKSAEKRARQALRKQAHNINTMSAIRTFEKKISSALYHKDIPNAEKLFNEYMSKSMKATSKGVLHAKTVSRKVGRIAEKLHSAKGK